MGQAVSTHFCGTKLVWKNSNPTPFHYSTSEYDLEARHREQLAELYHQTYDSATIRQYLIKKLIENKIAFEAQYLSNCIRVHRGGAFDYIYFCLDCIEYITYTRKSFKSATINIDLTKQCDDYVSINVVEQIIASIKAE